MNEVVIPLKITGIAQMKAELRELKGEIANATDPATMTALAQKAGELTDKIKDANEAVNVFASGSKFEQVSNGIGGIKDSLMSLDFAEAAEKSKVFATALGSIGKADITTAIKGMVTMIGTLSKAFIKLAITIMMNPIFWIVIAVVAIIAIIAAVLKSFGILDDVLRILMKPINDLIQGFKDLTDWMGLTAHAAEDSANRSAEALKKGSERSIIATDMATEAIDREIAEMKALGKNTHILEMKRTFIVQKGAMDRAALARKNYYKELKRGDEMDKEVISKLKEKLRAEDKLILDAMSQRRVMKNQQFVEENKPSRSHSSEPKSSKSPRAKDTGPAEIQKTIDEARLANLNATLEAIEVERNAVNAKYTDLLAKAKKYKKDTKELEILQMNELNDINVKERDKDNADKKAKIDQAKADAAALIAIEDAKYLEIQRLTAVNEKNKAIQIQLFKDYEKAVLLAEFDTKTALLKDKDALFIQLKQELTDKLSQINKDAADKELALVKETEEKKRAENKKTTDAAFDFAQKSMSAIESLTALSMDAKLKKVKKGSKEEEELLKKQFYLNKKLQLASAVIDAGKAITSILAQYPKFDGGFAMSAALGFAAITSATTIAKIAATTFDSPGGAPNDAGAGTIAVAPSGPSLFGQANTGSQVNAGGGSNNITVTAVVSETEITASQNHINNIQNNSVL